MRVQVQCYVNIHTSATCVVIYRYTRVIPASFVYLCPYLHIHTSATCVINCMYEPASSIYLCPYLHIHTSDVCLVNCMYKRDTCVHMCTCILIYRFKHLPPVSLTIGTNVLPASLISLCPYLRITTFLTCVVYCRLSAYA